MFNKVVLIGRFTAEPEVKKTPNGVSTVSFQIAVDRRYKGQDGERKADFPNIVCWRQQAEFVGKYFHKGDAIGIEGSLQTRNYEDKNGNKRTAVEVVADNVFFVGGKSNGGNGGTAKDTSAAAPSPAPAATSDGFQVIDDDDGDLPF